MSMDKRKLLDSTVISAATDTISARLRWIDHLAVQVNTSAVSSPVGVTVKLQASNDDTNWDDLAGTTNSITGTGNVLINAANVGYKYIRASFALTSGTVTSEVIFTGKERNI